MEPTFAPTSTRVAPTRRASLVGAFAMTVVFAGAAFAWSALGSRDASAAGAAGFTGTEAFVRAEVADRYTTAAPRDVDVFIRGEIDDRYGRQPDRAIDVFVRGEVEDRYGR